MFLPAISRAESKDIPFTLDDRDRIIRTEQKLEALKTEMKIRFDANAAASFLNRMKKISGNPSPLVAAP